MKKLVIAISFGLASTALWAQYMPPPPPAGYPASPVISPAPINFVSADRDTRPVSFLVGGAFTLGGDTLATVTYIDGSQSSIKAGGLFLVKMGADWRINPLFSVQGTVGYHFDQVTARNGEMGFSRNFIEGLAFVNAAPKHRFGLGLRQTSSAKRTSSGAASSVGNAEYSSSLGVILEYEWMLARYGPRGYGFTVRGVSEKYTPTSLNGAPATGPDVNGSHIGIGFNFYF